SGELVRYGGYFEFKNGDLLGGGAKVTGLLYSIAKENEKVEYTGKFNCSTKYVDLPHKIP
ncbi:MAG: hypothetical protein ABL958_16550, partial [Bdellovibrionia bacterium]